MPNSTENDFLLPPEPNLFQFIRKAVFEGIAIAMLLGFLVPKPVGFMDQGRPRLILTLAFFGAIMGAVVGVGHWFLKKNEHKRPPGRPGS